METTFQISLYVKSPSGFETYGTFELGPDREKAMEIFDQLKGTDEITDNSVLYMDLSEIKEHIPFPIAIRHCTLDDIAFNARVITRDIFKILSL